MHLAKVKEKFLRQVAIWTLISAHLDGLGLVEPEYLGLGVGAGPAGNWLDPGRGPSWKDFFLSQFWLCMRGGNIERFYILLSS